MTNAYSSINVAKVHVSADFNIYTIHYSVKIKTIKIYNNSSVIWRYLYMYKLVITQYGDI